jgi:hypothetical protein
MTLRDKELNPFQWRIRPGLLLVLGSVLILAIYDKTRLGYSFRHDRETASHAILGAAIVAAAVGLGFLKRDLLSLRSWRKTIALAGVALLALSIVSYASYTLVPLKFIVPHRLVYEVALLCWRWQSTGVLPLLAWIASLFGRGWSRVALVVSGMLLILGVSF